MVTVTEPLAIHCPTCGLSRSFPAGGAPSRFPSRCPACGAALVADRLLAPEAGAAPGDAGAPTTTPDGARERRFPAPAPWQVAALLAFAVVLAASRASHGLLAGILSGADLVFHEAGHPIAGILGWPLLTYLGGTLAQLAIPAAAAFAFALRRRTAAFAAVLVWLAFNLVDVGAYAADAMDRALPLLAPDADAHDWWNILGALGVRERCRAIGGAIAGAGWVLWAAAPGWAAWLWLRALRAAR
jgi:hypothetical protein